jgi:hypothetical protein
MYRLLKGLESGRRGAAARPLQLARTVVWSFFGVRKRSGLESDAASLTPLQVICAGLIGTAVLVACLLSLVRFIVH